MLTTNIAAVEDYARFFLGERFSEQELAMLRFHAEVEHATLTQIAKAAGWKTYQPANSAYGRLGFRIAAKLGLTPLTRDGGKPFGLSVIGYDGPRGPKDSYVLSMHAEVKEGLLKAGMIPE